MKIRNIPIILIVVLFAVAPVRAGLPGTYAIIPDNSNFFIYGKGSDYFVLRQGKILNSEIQSSLEKLSSGLRIVTPKDDPAGFAVSENLFKVYREVLQRSLNEEDMRNYLNFVDSAVERDSAVVKRMRLLATRASNGILSTEDRQLIQGEIDQLKREINMNAEFSQFNRKKVIPQLTVEELGLDRVDVVTNPYNSLRILDETQTRLLKLRANLGAEANQLELRIKGKRIYYMKLMAAESRLRDLNMAEEISKLIKNRVLLKTNYGVLLLKRN